ncbi:hypothetical protein [Persephonella sp. KM09-Lau-8]|uniref:hypothetical protein n=1 Tax=Persephonella sp. KM09-Lau-8 TaxID=1158345 RepID=UPI0004959071|nr:hypothetical protein [Persephonella sp. KM09-Lau-8]
MEKKEVFEYIDGRLVQLNDSLMCVFPPGSFGQFSKVSFFTFDDGYSCFLLDDIYRVVLDSSALEYVIENPLFIVAVALEEPDGVLYAKEVARFSFDAKEIEEFQAFLSSIQKSREKEKRLESVIEKLKEKGLSMDEIEEILNHIDAG